SCVRLSRGPRAVFSRILLLFSLTDTMDEEEMAAGGQNQLFTILLVNSGRLAFPDYTVQRAAKVFRDREDLIRYEASMRALLEVTLAMQGGQWEQALELYTAAKRAWRELSANHDLRSGLYKPSCLTCPLDLYTDCFYENRREAIASRVQLLCESSVETLCDMLEDVWKSQEGKVCSLVSWDRFSSLQQAQVVAVLGESV
ncbi:hypothetical protein XENOCAPTIV_026751, partial [Xenoophorus captivus]